MKRPVELFRMRARRGTGGRLAGVISREKVPFVWLVCDMEKLVVNVLMGVYVPWY